MQLVGLRGSECATLADPLSGLCVALSLLQSAVWYPEPTTVLVPRSRSEELWRSQEGRALHNAGAAASLGLAARPKTCCSSASTSADEPRKLGACQTPRCGRGAAWCCKGGSRDARTCRISTLGRFDGGGTPAGMEGDTGMRGGMSISASSSSSYPSSPSSSPSDPSSMGAPSSCDRKNSLTASSKFPPALCRKNWACSGGQPVRSENIASCSSILSKCVF